MESALAVVALALTHGRAKEEQTKRCPPSGGFSLRGYATKPVCSALARHLTIANGVCAPKKVASGKQTEALNLKNQPVQGMGNSLRTADRTVQPARLGTQTDLQRACAPLDSGKWRLSAQKSDKWRTNRGVEFEKSAGSGHGKRLADTDMTTASTPIETVRADRVRQEFLSCMK
jgi:hypothetical protein